MNLDPVFAAWLKNHPAKPPPASPISTALSWVPGYTPTPGSYPPAGPPDYKSLIANDPIWKQTQQDLAAQGVQNAAQRGAAVQRALVNYGQVPDFGSAAGGLGLGGDALGFLNQDVTQLTRDLAQKNTDAGLSLISRMLDAHKRAQAGITNNLAARGIFRSGATPSLIGQEGLQYKQAGFDAQNSLLDTVMAAINGYVANQNAIQAQLRAGLGEAGDRQREQNPYVPPKPTTPAWPGDVNPTTYAGPDPAADFRRTVAAAKAAKPPPANDAWNAWLRAGR